MPDLTERVRFAPAGGGAGQPPPVMAADEDLMKDFRPSDTLVTVHATTGGR